MREVVNCIEEKKKSCNSNPKLPKEKEVHFIKEGEKPFQTEVETRCYLDNAADWRVWADLDGRLKVPEDIAVTNLRPDIMLIYKSTKNVGIVELTVPSEERVELSGELKRTKYAGLKEEGRKNGWKMQVWAIEVGCRGFPASSMVTFLKEMGFQGCERKRRLQKLGQIAECASSAIWRWSHFKSWGAN